MEPALVFMLLAFAGLAIHHVVRGDEDRGGAEPCRSDDMRPGRVELTGVVRCPAGSLMRAPLSGRMAVGYWVVIEQERGPTAWEPVVELAELANFELEDTAGRVAVRAAPEAVHADIFELRGSGGPFAPLPGRVERLLHEHRRSTQGVLFGKAFRWREQIIEPGHEVSLRGWARRTATNIDADPAECSGARDVARLGADLADPYRGAATRWVLGATRSAPLQVIDRSERARRPFRWRRLVRT